MANVASQTITVDVRGPFKLCSICMTCTDVAGLKLLELLLSAEFVGLGTTRSVSGSRAGREDASTYHDGNKDRYNRPEVDSRRRILVRLDLAGADYFEGASGPGAQIPATEIFSASESS